MWRKEKVGLRQLVCLHPALVFFPTFFSFTTTNSTPAPFLGPLKPETLPGPDTLQGTLGNHSESSKTCFKFQALNLANIKSPLLHAGSPITSCGYCYFDHGDVVSGRSRVLL